MATCRTAPSLPWLSAVVAALVACGSGADATGQRELDHTADAGADAAPGPSSDASAPAGGDLAPCDVSLLWPVPRTGELPPGYLKLVPKAGERGPGVPPEALEQIPDLHGDLPRQAVLAATAVIAMRVDPCAPAPGGGCVRELRLSAEPLSPSLDDAAVHLIYELDAPTFDALVADLRRLRDRSPAPTAGPLRVHPGLAQAGTGSTYAEDVHDVVVKYATEQALVRVTANTFAFDNWGFLRIDRTASGWERTDLPGLPAGTKSQAWLRQAQQDSLDDPSGTITPAPAESFTALLRADALANGPQTPEVLAARDAIVELEHPARANAATHDCASCHLAGPAHLWAEKRGVSFATPQAYVAPPGVDVSVEVPPELDGNLSNTIAFGWHRARHEIALPSISARVAHETAEVLARLRAP